MEECKRVTGKPPIGTRWIDINKGDSVRTNYRSRLVAKEFKVDVRPELFAATPPTEWFCLLLSRAAESNHNNVCISTWPEPTLTQKQSVRLTSNCLRRILGQKKTGSSGSS